MNIILRNLNTNKAYKTITTASLVPFLVIIALYFPGNIPKNLNFFFEENGFYESFSFIAAIFSSIISFKLFLKTRLKGFLVMFILSFLFAMEEISWGYHYLSGLIDYSPIISGNNNQNEPNLHNFMMMEKFDVRDLLTFLLSALFSYTL